MLQATWSRNQGLIAIRGMRLFSFLQNPDWLWCQPDIYSRHTGSAWNGGKATGQETDHSSPYSAKVKNVWSCKSSLPYTFVAWCIFKHRNYSNFLYISIIKCSIFLPTVINIIIVMPYTNIVSLLENINHAICICNSNRITIFSMRLPKHCSWLKLIVVWKFLSTALKEKQFNYRPILLNREESRSAY